MAKEIKFDKREVFEEKIRPKLDELILLCRLHSIPCFFTACVKNTDMDSEYFNHIEEPYSKLDFINDAVGTGSKELLLKEDQIVKHLAVAAGFDVIPKRAEIEVSFDTFDSLDDDEMVFPGIDEDF